MTNPEPKKFRFSMLVRGILPAEELQNAPIDWEKTIVEYKRTATYNGVLRALTAPVTFVYKGAGLLRQEFYQYGIRANIKLIIEERQSDWSYKQIYRGKADFTTFEDGEHSASVNFTEDNLTVAIKANEGVKYPIPLNVPEALTITLNPLRVKESADLLATPGGDPMGDTYVGIEIINNEQHATVASVKNVTRAINVTPNFATDNDWFYKATTDTNVRIKGNITGIVSGVPAATKRFKLSFILSNGVPLKELIDITVVGVVFTPFSVDFDIVSDFPADMRLFLYVEAVGSGTSAAGVTISESIISLSYTTASPASTCKALPASYVFDKLVQLMNGADTGGIYTPYPTNSFLLSGALKQLAITCSNSIRKIENGTVYTAGDELSYGSRYLVVNAPITYNSTILNPGDEFSPVTGVLTFTSVDGSVVLVSFAENLNYSFKDFFQTIYAIQGGNASFGIDNGMAFLEDLPYVMQNVSILACGADRTGVKVSPAIEQLYNSIKVGYEDGEYDSLNAGQVVNSGQIYRVLDLPVNKELNLISPTPAEAYGIEQVRVTPNDTAASRSDNKNWLLWLNEALTYPLTTEDITGVEAGSTYYNWYLSPKNNLLRGGAYLRSIFFGLDGQQILFTQADKNFQMRVGAVYEGDSIPITSLPSAIFSPISAEFDTNLQYNALDNLDASPYGTVSFVWRGVTLKGFIQEVSVDIGQNSTRSFKLLLIAGSNLAGLVR